jgi:two-component system, sporulation sensor kinase E
MAGKSNFLDKVLGRIGRLDAHGLQTVVRRLARERDFLETLFNTIEDGVLVLDESGRILYFNQSVTKLLGLQQGAEGQLIERYLPEFEWQKLAALDREGGPGVARHEFEVHYPRPRVISLYAAPLDGEATGSSGLALILHDATEARLKTFEAIESERMQALTLLAASVAHEIGNPLNALHIHLQLIERELRKLRAKDTERIQGYVGVAKGEIARLDYIVRQFLQAIRPTPPKLTLAQLNDAVRATIELLRPEIDNRGIVLEQKLARQLPEVRMDPAQIQQALVNLVRNALQAMTKGGVLHLQTGQSSENVWVSVADDGCGIPADHVKRIFEPFYTTKKKGSGLGLMIVQRIVRDHGGGIELESRVGQGTKFRIWLPLHERGPRLLSAGNA